MLRLRTFEEGEVEIYSDVISTVTLRPISDISLQHKAGGIGSNAECNGSSKTGYNMLNETTADDDTTVIGHHGIDEDDTVNELISEFNLTNININKWIKIKAIRPYIRWRNDQSNGTCEVYLTVSVNGNNGKESTWNSEGNSNGYKNYSDSYEWLSYCITDKYYADSNLDINLKIRTRVGSKDRKNRMDLNITQVYIEMDYYEKL